MKKNWFYLMLVLFVVIGIGYGFLREVLRGVTARTFDPLLIILFDIFSALIFMALLLWLAFYLSRNGMSKPLALLQIVVGTLLTFCPLIRHTGIVPMAFDFLGRMNYPGFSLVTGSFLLISGIVFLIHPVQPQR